MTWSKLLSDAEAMDRRARERLAFLDPGSRPEEAGKAAQLALSALALAITDLPPDSPDLVRVLVTVANICAASREPDLQRSAKEQFLRAATLLGGTSEYAGVLLGQAGMVARQLGDDTTAVVLLQRSLSAKPDDCLEVPLIHALVNTAQYHETALRGARQLERLHQQVKTSPYLERVHQGSQAELVLRVAMCHCLIPLGDLEGAREHLEEVDRILRRRAITLPVPLASELADLRRRSIGNR